MIDRRDLLRGVGASMALAALGPFAGCSSQSVRTRTQVAAARDPLRTALRTAVARLSERFEHAGAYQLERRRIAVFIDGMDTNIIEQRSTVLVLTGGTGPAHFERCVNDASPPQVAAITRSLLAAANGTNRSPRDLPPAQEAQAPLAFDPDQVTASGWIDRAQAITTRAHQISSSRLIYRAQHLSCDDDLLWTVSGDGDIAQRRVRTRMGVTFVAWRGGEPMVGESEIATADGPNPELLAESAIESAAAAALALFTPSAPPIGVRSVLLEPRVYATILDRALPTVLRGDSFAPSLVIADDPTLRAYGRYSHDDTSAPGVARTLIAGGTVVGALGAGSQRRSEPHWRLVTSPSNLVIAPSTIPVSDLSGRIDEGLIVTGVRSVFIDERDALVVRARAKEVVRGRLTGRAWDDVELRANVHALHANIEGIAAESEAIGFGAGGPPRAVIAPWILTRATIGTGRGGA